MAKTPTKAAAPTAKPKTPKAAPKAPKAATKAAGTPAPADVAVEKPAKLPKAATSNGAAPAAAAKTPKTPKTPKTAKPPKPAKATPLEVLTESISQIASEILADRIVPTLAQIKALAEHALTGKKGKKAKAKKAGAKK